MLVKSAVHSTLGKAIMHFLNNSTKPFSYILLIQEITSNWFAVKFIKISNIANIQYPSLIKMRFKSKILS